MLFLFLYPAYFKEQRFLGENRDKSTLHYTLSAFISTAALGKSLHGAVTSSFTLPLNFSHLLAINSLIRSHSFLHLLSGSFIRSSMVSYTGEYAHFYSLFTRVIHLLILVAVHSLVHPNTHSFDFYILLCIHSSTHSLIHLFVHSSITNPRHLAQRQSPRYRLLHVSHSALCLGPQMAV